MKIKLLAAPLLAFLALASASSPSTAAASDWLKTIENLGWEEVVAEDDSAALVRPAHQEGPFVRIWVRYEFRDPIIAGEHRIFSMAALEEYDCEARRSRAIQRVAYDQNNLRGPSITIDKPGEWSFTLPDTHGAAMTDRVCRDVR